MLHDAHQLDGIVTPALMRQHFGEFGVGAHALLLLGHADVGSVYVGWADLPAASPRPSRKGSSGSRFSSEVVQALLTTRVA